MNDSRRRRLLGAALAVTVLTVLFAPPAEEDDISAPVVRAGPAPATTGRSSAAEATHILAIRPRSDDDPATLLATRERPVAASPVVAARPVAVVEVPAAEQAPALPFQFIGRSEQAGVQSIFVSHGEQTLMLRPGDVIDKIWRVAAIEGNAVRFVYLPLDETKSLSLGDNP